MKLFGSILIVGLLAGTALGFQSNLPPELSTKTRECVECHRELNPGLYQHWGTSKHYGANVGCYECHRADKTDKDVLKDDIHDDFTVATIVSPIDCASCHAKGQGPGAGAAVPPSPSNPTKTLHPSGPTMTRPSSGAATSITHGSPELMST